MKLETKIIYRLGIGLVLFAGILWTIMNVLEAGRFSQKMRDRLSSLKNLQAIKQKQDYLESALAQLAVISNAAPSLAALASSMVTGSVAEVREIETRPLGKGLSVKRAEITFNEVPLNSIAEFLRAVETQRPPWRLAECAISSSQKADGDGTARLILETVVKTASKP